MSHAQGIQFNGHFGMERVPDPYEIIGYTPENFALINLQTLGLKSVT